MATKSFIAMFGFLAAFVLGGVLSMYCFSSKVPESRSNDLRVFVAFPIGSGYFPQRRDLPIEAEEIIRHLQAGTIREMPAWKLFAALPTADFVSGDGTRSEFEWILDVSPDPGKRRSAYETSMSLMIGTDGYKIVSCVISGP
jgi:hypothetical protein